MPSDAADETSPVPRVGFPLFVYTLLRLALFAIPFAILVVLGLDVLWAMLLAALASSIASIFVLNRSRDAVSTALAARSDRAKQRMAERTQVEDAWDDARRSTEPDSGAEPLSGS